MSEKAASPNPIHGKKRREALLLTLPLIFGLICFSILRLPGTEWIDDRSRDLLMKFQGRSERDDSVLLLYLDEATFKAFGLPLSQWYRPLGTLTERLVDDGARAIAYDFLFLPTDEGAPATLPLVRALQKARAARVSTILASEIAPDGKIKYPYPLLRLSAAGTGFFNVSPSSDGVIRYQETQVTSDEGPLLSLASATASMIEGISAESFPNRHPRRVRIHFQRKGTFESHSIKDYLEGRTSITASDRVVMVGPSPDFLSDLFTTPMNFMNNDPTALFSGLEIHATVLTNLVRKRYVRDLPPLHLYGILLVGGVTILLGAALRRTAGLLLAAVLLALFYTTFSWQALRYGVGLPYLGILVPWTLQATATMAVRFWGLDRKKRVLEKAFGRYVNPLLLRSIMEHEDEIEESGKMVEACIFVTDLKGFTTISEWMDPRDLVAMLNEYFEWTTSIVREEGGLVLSFPGDAILAVFGVPVETEDKGSTAAVRAALRLWAEAEKRKVSVHVAISKGPLVIGRIGSRFKSDFTVIGDTVNTAFRIEAHSDQDGFVVTENVLLSVTRSVADRCEYVQTTEVMVKGKGKAVPIVKIRPNKEVPS